MEGAKKERKTSVGKYGIRKGRHGAGAYGKKEETIEERQTWERIRGKQE